MNRIRTGAAARLFLLLFGISVWSLMESTIDAAPRKIGGVTTIPITQDAWGLLPPRPIEDEDADTEPEERLPTLAELLDNDVAAGVPRMAGGYPPASVMLADLLPDRRGEELLLGWETGMMALIAVDGSAGRSATGAAPTMLPTPRLVCASPLPLGRDITQPLDDGTFIYFDAGRVRQPGDEAVVRSVVAVLVVSSGEPTASLQLIAPPTTESSSDADHVPFQLLASFEVELLAPLSPPSGADLDPRLNLLHDLDGDGFDELFFPFAPPGWADVPDAAESSIAIRPHAMPAPPPSGGLGIQTSTIYGSGAIEYPDPDRDGEEPRISNVSAYWRWGTMSAQLDLVDWNGDGLVDLFYRDPNADYQPDEVALLNTGRRVEDASSVDEVNELGRLVWDVPPTRLETRAPDAGRRRWEDIDGDSLPDLIAINSNMDVAAPRTRLSIYAGADQPRDGDTITYRVPSQIVRSRDAVGIALTRDFDGDGRPDLVLSNLAYVFGSVSDFAEAMLAEQITMGLRFHRGLVSRESGSETPGASRGGRGHDGAPLPLFDERPWAEVEYSVEMGSAGGQNWLLPGGDFDGDGAEELIVTLSSDEMGMLAVGRDGVHGPVVTFGPAAASWIPAPIDDRPGDELLFISARSTIVVGIIYFE